MQLIILDRRREGVKYCKYSCDTASWSIFFFGARRLAHAIHGYQRAFLFLGQVLGLQIIAKLERVQVWDYLLAWLASRLYVTVNAPNLNARAFGYSNSRVPSAMPEVARTKSGFWKYLFGCKSTWPQFRVGPWELKDIFADLSVNVLLC